MGVGLAKRPPALDLTVAQRIIGVWIVTIPITAFLGYWLFRILKPFGFE
jgi:phosphate/sulfate permease